MAEASRTGAEVGIYVIQGGNPFSSLARVLFLGVLAEIIFLFPNVRRRTRNEARNEIPSRTASRCAACAWQCVYCLTAYVTVTHIIQNLLYA